YRPGRLFLLRARAEPDPAGGYRITPPGEQDSSYLSSLAESNVLVSLPADRDRVEEGGMAQAIWLGRD
ncbi:MAG TPA: molybdopterin molybdenumtransferase MoeA, partial [Planctomycetota bacterium]|nr:molybdopterin molybdenumtransferase MoeA [Planctomycetota bacterium]